MPLEITYWTGSAPENENVAGTVISNEQRTLTTSSAQSGATPDGAVIVSIFSTEAARFEYSGTSPTAAATSTYIGANERLWLDAKPTFKIAGITA
jgi:hypothetical protein